MSDYDKSLHRQIGHHSCSCILHLFYRQYQCCLMANVQNHVVTSVPFISCIVPLKNKFDMLRSIAVSATAQCSVKQFHSSYYECLHSFKFAYKTEHQTLFANQIKLLFEEGSLRSRDSFAACIYSLAKLVFSNIKVIEPPNGLYVVNVLIGCLINIYIIENI